jgi:hypothetical protein
MMKEQLRIADLCKTMRLAFNSIKALLEGRSFHHASGLVDTGIIQYQYGLLLDAPGQHLQKINDYTGTDATIGHHSHIFALPVDK